jgi:hypothetical protein
MHLKFKTEGEFGACNSGVLESEPAMNPLLQAMTGSGPVGFQLTNLQTPNAGPVIYLGLDIVKDAPWGRLSFQIVNNSEGSDSIQLDPSSLLKIYLDTLLCDDEITRMKLPAGSQWTGGPVTDDLGVHLELRPSQVIILPPGESLAFPIEIDNALASAVATGRMYFYYTNFSGAPDGRTSIPCFVHNPPVDGNAQWQLSCETVPRPDYPDGGDTIYVTMAGAGDIANYVMLNVYHAGDGTLPLPAGATPQLTLSCLTGDDDSALCSDDRLKAVDASLYQQVPDGRWRDPQKNTQQAYTTWSIVPTPQEGDLFPVDGVLMLRFDNIVSDLPANSAPAPVFIHHTGLPGFDDGYFPLMLSKVSPVPMVRDFYAEWGGQRIPDESTVQYGQVVLQWDVFGANDCIVGPTGQTGTVYPVNDSMSAPTETSELSYTLVARANGREYPQPPIAFQLAKPTSAAIQATFEYVDTEQKLAARSQRRLRYAWTLTVSWTSTGAASSIVSNPSLGTLSTSPNDKFVMSASSNSITDLPWLGQAFQIDALNAAGDISATAMASIVNNSGPRHR